MHKSNTPNTVTSTNTTTRRGSISTNSSGSGNMYDVDPMSKDGVGAGTLGHSGQNKQQGLQQQQQQGGGSGGFPSQFRNPWDGSGGTSAGSGGSGGSFLTPSQQEDLLQHMQRRKSSLIVPPTRAAGPDPHMYHQLYGMGSTGAGTLGGNSGVGVGGGQLEQRDPGFNSQFSFHTGNANVSGTRGFAMGGGGGGVGNINDFRRRQSVAASGYYSQGNSLQSGQVGQQLGQVGQLPQVPEQDVGQGKGQGQVGQGHSRFVPQSADAMGGGQDARGRKYSLQYTTNNQYHPVTAPSAFGGPQDFSQPPVKQVRRDSFPSPTSLHAQMSPLQQLQQQHQLLQQQQQQQQVPSLKPLEEIHPFINPTPQHRRASIHSQTVSPLNALTLSLTTTYSVCSPEFKYQTSKNPKRVLTKPSDPVDYSTPWDNVNSDYILYVNDILGDGSHNRKYLILDLLGQGTFGQVVKAQNLDTKEILAVKVVKSKPEYLNPSFMECKVLQILRNYDGFLKMKDSFIYKGHLCLVFELLGQNLFELLKQNKFHGLNMGLIHSFSKQLLTSLNILKDLHIIHCDLKPENILLETSDKPNLKVIDFGSACEENHTIYTYIQSRFYRAPEVILGLPYSSGIDMWSFGCVVAELFLGIPIFPGSSEFNQLTRIVQFVGVPPNWMLDRGKNTKKYFKYDQAANKYFMKTLDEYNQELQDKVNAAIQQGCKPPQVKYEEPGKKYFELTSLESLISLHRLNKVPADLVEANMKDREVLLHFLKGCFDLNPLNRYTPHQALLHPFITKQPFSGSWYPPGSTVSQQHDGHASTNRNNSATTEMNNLQLQ